MDNIVNISNVKENVLEFNADLQGVNTDDMTVFFVIKAIGVDLSFEANHMSGTKWEVKIPPITLLDKTTYPFQMNVISDGYYFEPLRGMVNVMGSTDLYVSKPKHVTLQPRVGVGKSKTTEEDEEVKVVRQNPINIASMEPSEADELVTKILSKKSEIDNRVDTTDIIDDKLPSKPRSEFSIKDFIANKTKKVDDDSDFNSDFKLPEIKPRTSAVDDTALVDKLVKAKEKGIDNQELDFATLVTGTGDNKELADKLAKLKLDSEYDDKTEEKKDDKKDEEIELSLGITETVKPKRGRPKKSVKVSTKNTSSKKASKRKSRKELSGDSIIPTISTKDDDDVKNVLEGIKNQEKEEKRIKAKEGRERRKREREEKMRLIEEKLEQENKVKEILNETKKSKKKVVTTKPIKKKGIVVH